MKNLITLVSSDEIENFMLSLWKSDIFRNSHQNGGFIYQQVKNFSWLPRMFAEMTNDRLERAHFSTWWNVIMLRDDYTNPIVHDLYYLHEMTHASSMPYVIDMGKNAFDEKMQRNELEASVQSEIMVYFELPGLRERSFSHEIYADRFLNDGYYQDLWDMNPRVATETIRTARRDVMVSKPEHLMDDTERWIRIFAEQNAVYALTWSDRYTEIETNMTYFQKAVGVVGRKTAAGLYRQFIERQAAIDPIDNIPFRQEAELFSAFYWANKEKYAKANG